MSPLFRKKTSQPPTPAAPPPRPAPAPAPPDLGETCARLSAAIDIFVSGDLRNPDTLMTITSALGAGHAPRHFPETSIWAQSLPFADRAAAAEQWLIVVKLHQMSVYWNDEALPEFRRAAPGLVEMIGWARHADREALREKAWDAAQRLSPRTVVFASSGETIGDILFTESLVLGRAVDWMANPAPPPPPGPSIRERLDAVLERARQGDAAAVAYERALAAETDEQTRRHLEAAASLGSVDAMEAAAEMADAAGDAPSEAFWAEAAAKAGSVRGMKRLGAICLASDRFEDAVTWLQEAGRGGDPGAYALLARMANESGDHASAQHWAEVGSEAGDGECMRMRASYMLNQGTAEATALAHTWFVEAARCGNDRAMFQAARLVDVLGNPAQAAYWLRHAAARGNADALQLLDA